MNRTLIIILLLYGSTTSFAQGVTGDRLMRLEDVLIRVEKAFPSLKSFEMRRQALEQQATAATAIMAPMFNVSTSSFAYRSMMWKEESPMNQAGIMLSLSQSVPNPAALKARKNYYKSLTEVEFNKQQWTKNILLTQAKLLYSQHVNAERKMAILNESEQLLRVILKVAEQKYEYNQAPLSLIYKAKSKLGDIQNMREMQTSVIRSLEIGLNTLMNLPVATPFAADTSRLLEKLLNPQFIVEDSNAFSGRSDIQVMSSSINSMRKDQMIKAAMRKPDFNIGLSHNQMLGMPNSWTIMAGISLPIVPWTSKGWKAEIKMADFEIAAMEKEKESMQLMAKQMIAEKRSMIFLENRQLNNYKNIIIPELRKNVETALLQYQQTSENLFVLLDAWEMLLMKKMEQEEKILTIMQLIAEYEFEMEKN